uniref:Uncharacterized protein n=1 Tax=Anguilla anguilla TaxID=7936 RepID=A0A0E9WAF1_ANGAN
MALFKPLYTILAHQFSISYIKDNKQFKIIKYGRMQ